jgi:hypothetical protein
MEAVVEGRPIEGDQKAVVVNQKKAKPTVDGIDNPENEVRRLLSEMRMVIVKFCQ